MTRDDAVARIQQGLGFRDDLTTQIVAALKEAKRLLEKGRSLPGFLLVENDTFLAPAGNAEIVFPAGWMREWQEEPPWYIRASDPDNVLFLSKLDYNIGLARFAGKDPGKPLAYTLRSFGYVVWPARDVDYTIHWSWFKHSKDLSTNISDNEWLDEVDGAPEALIGRAGMIVAADLADTPSLQKFSSMYNIAWNGALNEDQLHDEENRPLAMGSRL